MKENLEPMHVIPVPDWIVRALYRHGLSLMDLSDYTRVSGVLSANDMAEWLEFYMEAKVQGVPLCWPELAFEDCFDSKCAGVTEAQHFKNAKMLYIHPDIKASVKARLERAPLNPDIKSDPYRFMISGRRIYVSFKEGCAPWTINDADAFEFFKNYLRQCYVVASVEEVATSSVFKKYTQYLSRS